MSGERSPADGEPPRAGRANDDGLRRLLIWTAIALIVSIVMAIIGVTLAVHWFDRPRA